MREAVLKVIEEHKKTGVPLSIWKDGKVVRNSQSYGGWAREIAEQKHVAFVDLNEIIAKHYDALGEAKVESLFADPHTHTGRTGAELNAEAVVAGLKALAKDPAYVCEAREVATLMEQLRGPR